MKHPSRVRGAVPEALGDLVLWCLEKDPAARPQTTAELLYQTSLAGRLRLPLLMLGGEHNFANPITDQDALFRAFGTPADQKHAGL